MIDGPLAEAEQLAAAMVDRGAPRGLSPDERRAVEVLAAAVARGVAELLVSEYRVEASRSPGHPPTAAG